MSESVPGPIMIIDDSDDARAQLVELLGDAGYETVGASSGRNALHYLTSDRPLPSLILLDLEMPGISGWDLMNILQSYLRLSAVPIVVVSGVDLKRHPYRGQVVRYLRKPIDVKQLLSVVSTFVGAAPGRPAAKVVSVTESVH